MSKLKTILDQLPASEAQWDGLLAEAAALKLDPEWVRRCQREEFTLLVRRAVADCQVTPQEHRKLELARILIGLPESEVTEILERVATEFESICGKTIEGRPASQTTG